jgi:protein-serine/threonine kinase
MQQGLGLGNAPSSPLPASVSASGSTLGSGEIAPGGGLRDSHHKQVFRRTYSSNSIKTRSVSRLLHVKRGSADATQVEVTPSSFQKIKLLGKGDVGKVYLVRENKLYAMKGESVASRTLAE